MHVNSVHAAAAHMEFAGHSNGTGSIGWQGDERIRRLLSLASVFLPAFLP